MASNPNLAEYLFDLFKPLRSRAFSISSAIEQHPGELHLTVALVSYRTKMATPREGVCSRWLQQLAPGQRATLRVEKGTFKLPEASRPLVMIGPGTLSCFFRCARAALRTLSRMRALCRWLALKLQRRTSGARLRRHWMRTVPRMHPAQGGKRGRGEKHIVLWKSELRQRLPLR